MANVIRVSKSNEYRNAQGNPLPLRKASLYKLHHLQKYPEIFSRIGRTLLLDLDRLDDLIEEGRLVNRLSSKSLSR